MNTLARITVVSLSLMGSAMFASAAEESTSPGVAARVVSMTDTELATNNIKRIGLGNVVLTSGHIVAADPLIQPGRKSFLVTVPPGQYPVTLYEMEGRIAAASMRFGDGEPDHWQLAVIEGQNLKALKPGEIFGYGVDTGLGCFMDKDTAALIEERDAKVQAERGSAYISYYDDVLYDELKVNGDDYALHQPIADKPGNAAIFATGWGDGFYPVFWGLNKDGVPVVILTEFQVITTLREAGK